MKIQSLIEELNKIYKQQGNVDIFVFDSEYKCTSSIECIKIQDDGVVLYDFDYFKGDSNER